MILLHGEWKSCVVCRGRGSVQLGPCVRTRCVPCGGRGFLFVTFGNGYPRVQSTAGKPNLGWKGGEKKTKAACVLLVLGALGCSKEGVNAPVVADAGDEADGGGVPFKGYRDAMESDVTVGADVPTVKADAILVSDVSGSADLGADVPSAFEARPDILAAVDAGRTDTKGWPRCLPDPYPDNYSGNVNCLRPSALATCYAVNEKADGGLRPTNYPCFRGDLVYVGSCEECPQ